MVIEVYASPLIETLFTESELMELMKDFKEYKSGEFIETFGKDVPYNHANTLPSVKAEDIWHIHLININQSFKKHVPQDRKTSDDHLVYCSGYTNPKAFLLITVLQPNAHEQARNNSIMFNLAEIAKNFRLKF